MTEQQTAHPPGTAIVVQHDFPKPPETVWRVLTEPSLLANWLMPNDVKPEVGHQFTFRRDPMPLIGFDGVLRCKVLIVEPFTKFSYTWVGGPLNTVLTWTLTPYATGTLLRLEQTGFNPKNPIQVLAYNAMNQGWNDDSRLRPTIMSLP